MVRVFVEVRRGFMEKPQLRRSSLFHPVLSRRMVQSASDWPLVSRTTQKNLTNKSCPLPVKKRKDFPNASTNQNTKR